MSCSGALGAGRRSASRTWDHRPTAQELLDARLARGWQPTATATKDGEKILGFACVVCAEHRARG
jgi:hypothetical protein